MSYFVHLFPILRSFSLKPLTRNHSYISWFTTFFESECDEHSATWHFYSAFVKKLSLISFILILGPKVKPIKPIKTYYYTLNHIIGKYVIKPIKALFW